MSSPEIAEKFTVSKIDADNFDGEMKFIHDGSNCTAILFYVDSCPHCVAFKPIYNEFARKVGFADVYAMDCVENSQTKDELNNSKQPIEISGYPTLYFFKDGIPVEKYEGPRDADALVAHMMNEVCPPKSPSETS